MIYTEAAKNNEKFQEERDKVNKTVAMFGQQARQLKIVEKNQFKKHVQNVFFNGQEVKYEEKSEEVGKKEEQK